MEDVLEVYSRPLDPEVPVLCVDEFCKQLLSETRAPLPAKPGVSAKYDYEYVREGSASAFMLSAPLLGQREVFIAEQARRTTEDFAHCLDYAATVMFPKAKKIVLVMDNLNTHALASLYATFDPSKAYELAQKFEIHYTPKHGSWLNIAEIEIAAMAKTCLSKRIDKEIFPKVVDEVSRLCEHGRQILTKTKDEHEHKRLENSIL
jgi:hypothetical protein